jgi:hypothetical protein
MLLQMSLLIAAWEQQSDVHDVGKVYRLLLLWALQDIDAYTSTHQSVDGVEKLVLCSSS